MLHSDKVLELWPFNIDTVKKIKNKQKPGNGSIYKSNTCIWTEYSNFLWIMVSSLLSVCIRVYIVFVW